MSETIEPQVEEIVKEAKSNFSLRDRLQGRKMRTATVPVYTDEVAGEKHIEALAQIADLKSLIVPTEGVVLSEEVVQITQEQIDILQKGIDELIEEVRKTGFTFNLRAVPKIVKKVAAKETRKYLGLKGAIPDDRIEEYIDEVNARLLAAVTLNYVDHESGETISGLSVEDARDLESFLPDFEYQRLISKVDDLLARTTIDESVTTQVDF